MKCLLLLDLQQPFFVCTVKLTSPARYEFVEARCRPIFFSGVVGSTKSQYSEEQQLFLLQPASDIIVSVVAVLIRFGLLNRRLKCQKGVLIELKHNV